MARPDASTSKPAPSISAPPAPPTARAAVRPPARSRLSDRCFTETKSPVTRCATSTTYFISTPAKMSLHVEVETATSECRSEPYGFRHAFTVRDRSQSPTATWIAHPPAPGYQV